MRYIYLHGNKTNNVSENTINNEKPFPTIEATDTGQIKNTK